MRQELFIWFFLSILFSKSKNTKKEEKQNEGRDCSTCTTGKNSSRVTSVDVDRTVSSHALHLFCDTKKRMSDKITNHDSKNLLITTEDDQEVPPSVNLHVESKDKRRGEEKKRRETRSRSLSLESEGTDEEEAPLTFHEEEEEEEEEDNEDDAVASVGKILIFKPRRRRPGGVFGRRRRYDRKCIPGSLCSCLMFVVVFSIILLVLLATFRQNNSSSLMSSRFFSFFTTNRDTTLSPKILWSKSFPFLTIESSFRSVQLKDGQELIMIPFGTSVDASIYDQEACNVFFSAKILKQYFKSRTKTSNGCGGGILALNSSTGQIVWSLFTQHELFAANCFIDLTSDGIKDCIFSGRLSGAYAVDSLDGRIIWSLSGSSHPSFINPVSNFYTPLILSLDVDGDSVNDIILMNGGDPFRQANGVVKNIAHLLLVSSVSGRILKVFPVPDSQESYYSPQQIFKQSDLDSSFGSILFGTGGETKGGSLWALNVREWLKADDNSQRLHGHRHQQKASLIQRILQDNFKGFMTPPLLRDVNQDSADDIIFNLFNESVTVLDGVSLRPLWITHFSGSESYSTPSIGKFGGDDGKDYICVQRSLGPGFPVYTHAQTILLEASTGKVSKILDSSLIGIQSSPLTLAVKSSSKDYCLFFRSTCFDDNDQEIHVNETTTRRYSFASGTSVHESSRADFCGLRFNGRSKLVTQLIAGNANKRVIVYDSRNHSRDEWNLFTNDKLWRENLIKDWKERQAGVNLQKTVEDDQELAESLLSESAGRKKRHIGVHDGSGVSRVISTPILVPSQEGVDVVFGVFWIPSSRASLDDDGDDGPLSRCLLKYSSPEIEAQVRLNNNLNQNLDHDAYQEAVKEICLKEVNGVNGIKDDEEQSFLTNKRINGSLTVYRVALLSEENKVAPINQQIWSQYLGKFVNSMA